jgi:hypothetical protein
MFTWRRGLILLAICLSVLAIWRGWVVFSRPQPTPQDNKPNVNVSVDPDKFKADVKKAEQKVEKKVGELIDRAKQSKNGASAPK